MRVNYTILRTVVSAFKTYIYSLFIVERTQCILWSMDPEKVCFYDQANSSIKVKNTNIHSAMFKYYNNEGIGICMYTTRKTYSSSISYCGWSKSTQPTVLIILWLHIQTLCSESAASCGVKHFSGSFHGGILIILTHSLLYSNFLKPIMTYSLRPTENIITHT